MEIVIEKYSAKELESVLSVLANAFITSPLHVSAFGPQRMDYNRLFFRIGLRDMFHGEAFVASVNGAVCGYAHFNAALGESQTLVHARWQSAEEIACWVAALPHAANSGDIYAQLP